MKTAQGFASIIRNNDVTNVQTKKKQQLEDIGVSKMQASRYEQLIKPENRPIVEK